jgi:hypothetical protein
MEGNKDVNKEMINYLNEREERGGEWLNRRRRRRRRIDNYFYYLY